MHLYRTMRFLAPFILLGYLLGVFSFFGPYMEYVINYNYIVTELCVEKDVEDSCCKGKCHLNEELREEQQKDTRQDVPVPASRQDISVHLAPSSNTQFTFSFLTSAWHNYASTIRNGFANQFTPPPEPCPFI